MTTAMSTQELSALIYEQGSPFARLSKMLADIPPGEKPIDLTIGEPRHAIPDFVAPILAQNIEEFRRYPAIHGINTYRSAVSDWLNRRYQLEGRLNPNHSILPLNGSREGLFYAALAAHKYIANKEQPVILLPNPFYQAYAGAALAAGAQAIFLNSPEKNGSFPDIAAIDPDLLKRTIACYIASPTNPQGTMASQETWRHLIETARHYNFMLFADECYSEIYRSTPPIGLLSVAATTNRFDNVVMFNSLSKRSNLAGLRCGFAAGDPAFMSIFRQLRNMTAPQVPTPLQAVGAAAWADEHHVEKNRTLYNEKFVLAETFLGTKFGFKTPPAGFFLWLNISALGTDETVAIKLWKEFGLRVMPGSYLCAPNTYDINPGMNFIRIAMVDDITLTKEALERLTCIWE